MLIGIVMLHDSTYHVIHTDQDLLHSVQWKIPDHPQCSQDLSSCDFSVSGFFKKALKPHRFGSGEDIRAMLVPVTDQGVLCSGNLWLVFEWVACLSTHGGCLHPEKSLNGVHLNRQLLIIIYYINLHDKQHV